MLLHGISLKTFVVFYSLRSLWFIPERPQIGRNSRFTCLAIETMAIDALERMKGVFADATILFAMLTLLFLVNRRAIITLPLFWIHFRAKFFILWACICSNWLIISRNSLAAEVDRYFIVNFWFFSFSKFDLVNWLIFTAEASALRQIIPNFFITTSSINSSPCEWIRISISR